MNRSVRCGNRDCDRFGIVVAVPARRVSGHIEARPALHCLDCGNAVEDLSDHARAEKAIESPPEKR